MNENDNIINSLKKIISEEFDIENFELNIDDSLFDSGIIDSLRMLKLMSLVEEKFRITINPSEVAIDNFETLKEIAEIILRKQTNQE